MIARVCHILPFIMIIKLIEQLIENDEYVLAIARKRLARSAKGTLRMRQQKGHTRFFYLPPASDDPVKEIYLSRTKDKKLLISLCSKVYYEELIFRLQEELRVLKTFLNGFDPNRKHQAIRILPEDAQLFVKPLIKTKEEYCKEWEQAPFTKNPHPFDHEPLRTKKGELVRSRAECIIANALYDLHIPYRYECILFLDDGSAVFPDFTILHPQTLEIYYLEFFGKMDDYGYAADNFNKIRRYANSEIFPHLIMIFDHREAPFNTDMLLSVLKNTFLAEKGPAAPVGLF